MTASFCKRNSADNEEINHYLTHLLKQDMIGVGFESCHMITRSKYNTLLFRIKTYMIFVQMNFYIIFQTVLINLFEVGFFFQKRMQVGFHRRLIKYANKRDVER